MYSRKSIPFATLILAEVFSGSAHSQSSFALEEVIVTAQKRQESLQDVALAVSALTGDKLSDGQITNVMDMQAMVPSVSIGENFGFAQIFVRGVGLDNVFTGADPSVSMHVDGAVIGRSAAQLGSFFDLERVEVLRGPQGTLYGRNATGGSFNLITKKPTEDLEGYARYTVGNYNKRSAELAIGGSITDSLLGRIAIKTDDRDGYAENTLLGKDIDDANQESFRGHLQYMFNDDLDVLMSYEYHAEDDAAYAFKAREETFPNDPAFSAIGSGSFASDERDIASDVDVQNDRETWSLSALVTWDINDSFSFKSISNYRDFETTPVIDLDVSPVPAVGISQQMESEQLSQEIQFIYNSENMKGIVGAFYYEEELFGDNRIGGSAPDKVPDSSLGVQFRGTTDIEAYALFANFDYSITDELVLILGGRYTYEERTANSDRIVAPPGSPARTFTDAGDFNEFSPKVGIEWAPNEEMMIYATYTEGFKSGIFLTGQSNPLLDPETVDAFEVGMKSRFFDDRLQLNATAFYYDYTDLQVGRTEVTSPGAFRVIFENAAAATNKGIELEASFMATENLRIDAMLGYLDATFDDFATVDPLLANTGSVAANAKGNRLVQAPEWTGNLRVAYTIPLSGSGTVDLGLETAFKDEVYFTPVNKDRLSQEEVTTVSANIKYTSEDEKWFVNLWGKNLTDEFVYANSFAISTSRTITGSQIPPRTFGATVGYSF